MLCVCLQAFGEDIAILAGDALLSLSFEYIARETRHVAPERVLRVSFLSLMPFAVMHTMLVSSIFTAACKCVTHDFVLYDIRVMFETVCICSL